MTRHPTLRPNLATDLFRGVVTTVFIVMTMAFVTVPYALSSHPGEPAPSAAVTADRHMS